MRKTIPVWLDALIDQAMFIRATGRDNDIQCQGIKNNVINGKIMAKIARKHETSV